MSAKFLPVLEFTWNEYPVEVGTMEVCKNIGPAYKHMRVERVMNFEHNVDNHKNDGWRYYTKMNFLFSKNKRFIFHNSCFQEHSLVLC